MVLIRAIILLISIKSILILLLLELGFILSLEKESMLLVGVIFRLAGLKARLSKIRFYIEPFLDCFFNLWGVNLVG